MPFLAMLLTAFVAQVFLGLVGDLILDLLVFCAVAAWVKGSRLIPQWMRGRK